MITLYFKQAWQLIKQNKLYSGIYVMGTSLAVAMTMVFAIVFYIKIAPIYPEMNRNRTLVVRSFVVKTKNDHRIGQLSQLFLKEYFYTLKTPEAVSGVLNVDDDNSIVEPKQGGALPVTTMYVDHHFWTVFPFSFISGKPFSDTDFNSALNSAVISASLANTLFGVLDAEGERFNLNGDVFRVSGVVKDVSTATPETYAHIWVPYSIRTKDIRPEKLPGGLHGQFHAYFLARSSDEIGAIKAEVHQMINNLNNSQDEFTIKLAGQPEIYWSNVFRKYGDREPEWMEILKSLGLLLLTFMVVPAVNLAGLVSSRMEKRIAEFGIRKVFGATKTLLMRQLLIENLLLTTIGGVVGLLLSYLIVLFTRNWILSLSYNYWIKLSADTFDTALRSDMLFNPALFLLTLLCCFILNFLSAMIPVGNIVKKEIVYSLNHMK